MIKNYIKIALRTMWRDRVFSLINLVGLAVGLASVLMILTYVRYELSYDRHYSNSPYVYRVEMTSKFSGTDVKRIDLPEELVSVLKKEFADITAYTTVNSSPFQFKYNEEVVNVEKLTGTPDFFKIFNLKFIHGDAHTALNEEASIVITKSTAEKYFKGIANPLGKTFFSSNEQRSYKITGVIKDIPSNTHFKTDVIISNVGRRVKPLSWQSYTSVPQYVLVNKNTSVTNLQSRIKTIYSKYNFPKDIAIQLRPVTDIHLYSHTEGEFKPNGDVKYIYIFSCVALLILLIASINYINLTTARSIQRAREIGVRKVLGAMKRQLVMQFLSESFIFFAACLALGLLIAKICWPSLSLLIDVSGNEVPLFDTGLVVIMISIAFVFGLLSGIYPAFILSRIKISQVLKGVTKFGINVSLRKLLVAVQFVISGVLIVSTLVIYQQLNYMRDAKLGFNKDNLISIPFFMYKANVATFKNELKNNSNIKDATVASWKAGMYFGSSSTMVDEKDSTKSFKFQYVNADPDFIKSMQIKVLRGRDFSRSIAADVFNIDSAEQKVGDNHEAYEKLELSRPIIVNQALLKMLGIKYADNLVLTQKAVRGTVVGLVEDFNGLTLHEEIPAVAIKCEPNAEFGHMYLRISSKNTAGTLKYIQNKWHQFYPDQSFQFSFVDDNLQQLYSSDKRVGQLFFVFAILAIIIACLGLFGLIALTVQQRVKEIGIRKVLGASVTNITAMLSKDFLKLVAISMIIASPIAWWGMNKWLQSFAYRIEIQWWFFAFAGILAVFIAFATISFQSIKAARANPVKSLRSE
jgi:putative ABC transport system permease protein